MEIKLNKNGSTATIFLSGRFESAEHRHFKEAFTPYLNDTAVELIEINLAEVSYVDSSALGMLLLREHAQEVYKKIALRAPNQHVKEILDIANFAKLFPIS
jgi:anti-anti-sigma factor